MKVEDVQEPVVVNVCILLYTLDILECHITTPGEGYLIVKCYWTCCSYGCVFHPKFPTYGSVFNLNSVRWVAFSEFLSQLKKFE